MVRSLLVRGMLVGLAAGVLAFVVAYFVGEPHVQAAIDFEERAAAMSHSAAEHEEVSRGVQRTWGLLLGNVAIGVALGGMFALAFAWAYGRIGAFSPRATAALLALGAYLTIVLVPFTKYPATPPAVGNPDTIDKRTVLFFTMIAISVLAAIGAGRLRRQLLPRLGAWNATIAAVGAFVAVVVLAQLILPTVNEIPNGFPADHLWGFRAASLGVNLTLWTTIGLGFGAAAQRLLAPASERRASAAPAVSPG